MNLKQRLTSRVFWVAVGSVILLAANEQWNEAAGVAIAFILGERANDTAKSLKKSK